MARKQQNQLIGQWITTKEAAAVLTMNSGHVVSEAYVRRLGLEGKIETYQVDERTKLYSRTDVERYRVRRRGDGSVRQAARAPRGGQDQDKQESEAEAVA